jgi:hypothetical protein
MMNTQNNTFVRAARVLAVSPRPIIATRTAAIMNAIAHPNIANLTPVRLHNGNIVTFQTQNFLAMGLKGPPRPKTERIGVDINLNIHKTSSLQAFREAARVHHHHGIEEM